MKPTLLISSLIVVVLNLGTWVNSLGQQRQSMLKTWADQTIGNTASTKPANGALTPISNNQRAHILPGDSTTGEVSQKLTAAGLKPDYASLYLGVEIQTGTPWQLLAAVHQVETGQRGDTPITSYAGAVGPMQFMPATFRAYAQDGDNNGTREATDVDDAVLTAGRYLAANGASRGNYSNALYHYNHSYTYVNQVMTIARRLGL